MASPFTNDDSSSALCNTITPRITRSHLATARTATMAAMTTRTPSTKTTTTTVSTRHVTPVVATVTTTTRGNDASSSTSPPTLTPADALRLTAAKTFPQRVLAMLWYAEQTNNPLIGWDDNDNNAFYLDGSSGNIALTQLLVDFFGKRMDLILRSISEWGFDVTMPNASDGMIQCQHPLVHRGVISIYTISNNLIPFVYQKRGRPRPRKAFAKALPSTTAAVGTESVTRHKHKARNQQPKRRQGRQPTTSVRQGNRGTKASAMIPLSPDPVPAAKTTTLSPDINTTVTSASATATTPTNALAPESSSLSPSTNSKALSTFPFVLARLLQELDDNQLQDIMHWNPAGTAVMVRRRKGKNGEERMIRLKQYFAHGNMALVRRQLDHYRFKIVQDREWTEYFHPLFQRNQLVPEKLSQMYRSPVLSDKKRRSHTKKAAAQAKRAPVAAPRVSTRNTSSMSDKQKNKKQTAPRASAAKSTQKTASRSSTAPSRTAKKANAASSKKKSTKKQQPAKARNKIASKQQYVGATRRTKKTKEAPKKKPPLSNMPAPAVTTKPKVHSQTVAAFATAPENDEATSVAVATGVGSLSSANSSRTMCIVPSPIARQGQGSLMDLIANFDLETAAAVVAQAEQGNMSINTGSSGGNSIPLSGGDGSPTMNYFTPQKNGMVSTGLTPLAETIHPLFETPGFNSVDSLSLTPGKTL